jgi:hypothetical protein
LDYLHVTIYCDRNEDSASCAQEKKHIISMRRHEPFHDAFLSFPQFLGGNLII